MQVRELARAPAVAPFRREHHEIERVRALDLEPARAAIAGLVGRIERLRHHAFVSRARALRRRTPALRRVERVIEPRNRQRRGHDVRQRSKRSRAGRSARLLAVAPQAIEEERAHRQLAAHALDVELAAEAAHRDLEGCGRPPASNAIASPSRISSRRRQAAHCLDDLRHRGGHLVRGCACRCARVARACAPGCARHPSSIRTRRRRQLLAALRRRRPPSAPASARSAT